MGIRRRLSRLWNETKDGILRGPGVDVDSVKADEAEINGSKVFIQDSEPSDMSNDDVWIDTS